MSIQRQCEIFGVSSSGYYKYINSNTSPEEIHHKKITRLVKKIYLDKGPDITNIQITNIINQHEKVTSQATVARIMKKYTDSTVENVQQYSVDDNLLFKADNLFALYHLQNEYKNKVKLIYIDVPYNTRNEKLSYKDSLSKSDYLLSLKNRLELARNLLKRNGSIFIQCDDNEQAYIKILCDEIFGLDNFVHQIVWKRSNSQQKKNIF